MRALSLFAAATAASAWASVPKEADPIAELKHQLQLILDNVSAVHNGTALQLGWKSATEEFALASGVVLKPGEKGPGRPATTKDTFLFGSGTKPLTASGVMALRDRGLLSLDDPLEKHIDPWLNRLHAGASFRGLFGENASRITVGHVLRMQSGVADFDFPAYDNFVLLPNETYLTHTPYEPISYAATQKPALLCDAGKCVSYSSSNYVLAGFVLLAHANVTDWWQLDLPSLFPPEAREYFEGLFFYQKEMLDNGRLTVPGHTGGGWAGTPPTIIFNQSATILGWTCGNMVGTALDVAKFYWGLLGPKPSVLPAATVQEMKEFKPLDLGWAAGSIQYGIGVMTESVTDGTKPPAAPEWGTYVGHGGDTYGFLSEQGIVSGLNASVSIVAAQDTDGSIITREAFCRSIKAAAKVLKGVELTFQCQTRPDPPVWARRQRNAVRLVV